MRVKGLRLRVEGLGFMVYGPALKTTSKFLQSNVPGSCYPRPQTLETSAARADIARMDSGWQDLQITHLLSKPTS